MSVFFDKIIKKASENIKTIVLPEGSDERTIDAAVNVLKLGFAKIIILGDIDRIIARLKEKGADPSGLQILNPATDARRDEFANAFYEMRKHKGITLQQADGIVQDESYFGTMLVKLGYADGLVSGARHSSADTIRPALQIIKPAEGIKTISSMFFMSFPRETLLFADCGLVEAPTEAQLCDIAISTAKTGLQFGFEPRIAMLSYSTKGSAKGEHAVKIALAAERAKERITAIFGDTVLIDGELQFDAAYIPATAATKAPDSPLKGRANTFIFPDLGAGNICYKSTQRLAGAEAYGPILQGLAKPINDLSRGCVARDIVATVGITSIQALS
ncbi:MAG: phosphate acetyltransferase [Phycisphaerae bacterium]|nr:phosphate acetyltransferase [Phycisphaerae bacterium]